MRFIVPFLVLALAFSAAAFGAEANCVPAGKVEELQYSWKLRGPLSWVAGLAFPTSGRGSLRNVEPRGKVVDSELRISGESREDGFYLYRSQIEPGDARTLMTYDGYAWRDKRRSERTLFDYVRRLARIRKENSERVEHKEKAIPRDTVRDVLTAIYFLRQHANDISVPLRSEIYSGGKLYPVIFKPIGTESVNVNGTPVSTRRFEITAAPETEKKWPGGVKVWLSDDEAHTPVRIEIKRDYAALQLDLDSIRACSR